ncbi:MAG: transglycosylase domain-containing protein [Acidimicrobiia bacterium]
MRFDERTAFSAIFIAGAAGAVLLLPAIALVGTLLSPSHPEPASAHVAPLLGEAIWARANGGRHTELQPINAFTVGRTVSCLILAERLESASDREDRQNECMTYMPAIQAVGYLSTVQMRADGVWQDPRVPFVQIAHMNRLTSSWSKAELLATLAERAEYANGIKGVEQAARAFFQRGTHELTLAQTATVAALLGDTRFDPWCAADRAVQRRRQVLERMRNNLAIDDSARAAADAADLGLSAPPPGHKPCAR